MTNVERIYRFLDNAKSYMFIGGGLAFGAPYGFHFFADDKLYFGREVLGRFPKELKDTSKIEIAAVGDGEYLRYSGDVKVIEDSTLWNCQEMCSQRTPKILDGQISCSVMRELLGSS